jgi:hypothetical protein
MILTHIFIMMVLNYYYYIFIEKLTIYFNIKYKLYLDNNYKKYYIYKI